MMQSLIFTCACAALAAIIIVDAVLYGFIAAFNRANFIEVSKQAQDGDAKAKKIEKLAEDESALTMGMYIIAIILNILLGTFIIDIVSGYISQDGYVRTIITIVVIVISVVLGIVVPGKAVCYNPDKWIYKFFTPAMIIMGIFTPVIWCVTKLSDIILLMLGKNPDEETDNVTEDEIITIVNEGQEQGIIEDSEAEMITKIIEFGDKQACDIMTHRMNINAIDGESTLEEAMHYILDGNNSRYPVFVNDINNIIGILHIKDAIKENEIEANRQKKICDIKGMMYEPEFIPETRNINDLFNLMRSNKIHMAVVVDEYGQTSGIVTMEDILEEIVGNIQDEHDEEEEMIQRRGEDVYVVDGKSLLEDLEDELHIEFDSSEYSTINGFMTGKLGKIPSKENIGFSFEYEGYEFKSLDVGHRVFTSISISKIQEV